MTHISIKTLKASIPFKALLVATAIGGLVYVSIPLKASIPFKEEESDLQVLLRATGFHTPQGINPLQSCRETQSANKSRSRVSIPLKASILFKVLATQIFTWTVAVMRFHTPQGINPLQSCCIVRSAFAPDLFPYPSRYQSSSKKVEFWWAACPPNSFHTPQGINPLQSQAARFTRATRPRRREGVSIPLKVSILFKGVYEKKA